jgi:hypothetical protein
MGRGQVATSQSFSGQCMQVAATLFVGGEEFTFCKYMF